MKDLYRGLGSIDIVAAARSVIQIEKCEDSETRILRHIKSSLAPRGKVLYFNLNSNSGIQWLDDIEPDMQSYESSGYEMKMSKQEQTARILRELLRDGPMRASDVRQAFKNDEISERTLLLTKKYLGIESFRKGGIWFWQIPGSEN